MRFELGLHPPSSSAAVDKGARIFMVGRLRVLPQVHIVGEDLRSWTATSTYLRYGESPANQRFAGHPVLSRLRPAAQKRPRARAPGGCSES